VTDPDREGRGCGSGTGPGVASSLVLIGIVVLAAFADLMDGAPAVSVSRPTEPLFEGSYRSQWVNLTAQRATNGSAVPSTVTLNGNRFTLLFSATPGGRNVVGYDVDPQGFVFAFWLMGEGPKNVTNWSTTWGAPDGEAIANWAALDGPIATVLLEVRSEPWSLQEAPAPSYSCPSATSNYVGFGGAFWSAGGSCQFGAPGPGGVGWTVYLPGFNSTVGFVEPGFTACSEWDDVHPSVQLPPTTICQGAYFDGTMLGLVLTGSGAEMLAMS
jgi:hypothetical protein